MKKILILLFSAVLFFSCEENEEICTECNGMFSETLTMYVFEESGPCTFDSLQTCLFVQFDSTFAEDAWKPFNQDICGFDYVPGYRYQLSVKRKKIGKDENGDKIYQYCLINIVQVIKKYL